MPRSEIQIECRSCTLFLREAKVTGFALRRHALRARHRVFAKAIFHPNLLGDDVSRRRFLGDGLSRVRRMHPQEVTFKRRLESSSPSKLGDFPYHFFKNPYHL